MKGFKNLVSSDNWSAEIERLQRLGLFAQHFSGSLREALNLSGDLILLRNPDNGFSLLHRMEQRWQYLSQNGKPLPQEVNVDPTGGDSIEAVVMRMPQTKDKTGSFASLVALWPELSAAWAEVGIGSLFVNAGQLLLPIFAMLVYDKIALQEYIEAVHECTERVKRLSEQISLAVEEWRMAPTVKALQSLRGISLIAAAISVAELGDISRFQHPKELMAYLGLVPSEHSSGDSIKRGHITKTGNSHARRVLVESAWTYKHHARVTKPLIKRQEELPRNICQISWKAQLRLCARYRRLMARKKTMQVVVIAIARELAAFMWAIAQEVKATA